jgi:hypothetical protein
MRRDHRTHPPVYPDRRRIMGAGLLSAALLAASLSGTAAGTASARAAADPAVITFWNAVAVDVVVVDAGKANAEAFLWWGFTHAAVYNAVVGITGRYEPYKWDPDAPEVASPEAAAATAAYRVLLEYFPASEAKLTTAYDTSLDGIPDGDPKEGGIRFGERAAARIIRLRTDDGRFADVPFEIPLGPGVWRPTAPTFTPFFDPWLAKMRPLLLRSNSQFRPHGPPALTSKRYTRDFKEVKELGSLEGSQRTPEQTETALFFSDIGVGAVQAALRDLVTRRGMNISDAARLFAATDLSIADGVGVSWDSKLQFGFWRPITAIHRARRDDNPHTRADADWEPLITTPPYPDYTSGLGSGLGAASRALAGVLGTNRIDLRITSVAAGVTRHYEFAGQLNRDVVDARVWSGVHFRTADVVGNAMGKEVGDWALDHYFQPLDDND